MAKSLDIGTAFLVAAESRDGVETYRSERNAFFAMENEDFAEEMLEKAGAFYIVRGQELFVVGEDALKFALITGRQSDYRRPMAHGVLNPGEEDAIAMLEVLMEAVLGSPSQEGEVVAATVPAAPIDGSSDTRYHRMIVERFLGRLGYKVHLISEALALLYAENPSAEDANGEMIPFSGIAISFGAGMVNVAVAWRARCLIEFSIPRGGDWIDEQVASVRNLSVSRVTNRKERDLDLSDPDPSNPLSAALRLYYAELVRQVIQSVAAEFKRRGTTLDTPVDIILGGGTSAPNGFARLFSDELSGVDLPVEIGDVRLATDPLKSVASGALIAARTEEKQTA